MQVQGQQGTVAVPTVAVVITTFNHARFLGEALDSVLAQTRPVDHIIVIDDGSTDNPQEVVSRYPRVTFIRQTNQGLSAARNAGLKVAGDDYVLFLDADDRLTPPAVETHLKSFAAKPHAAFAYGAYRFIDAEGNETVSVPLQDISSDPFGSLLGGNRIGMHATVMYRRQALVEAEGFDTGLRAAEDYDTYLRICRTNEVAVADEIVAEYRRHGANMSLNAPFMLDAVLKVLGRYKPSAHEGEALALWDAGTRQWSEFYVGQSVFRVRDTFGSERFWAACRQSAGLVATHPMTAARWGAQTLVRKVKPALRPLRRKLRTILAGPSGIGRVRMGQLRRTTPISANFGYDRGKPVDRHYVEQFLATHSADIAGDVLEIGDSSYTRRYGGNAVSRAFVFNRYPGAGTDFVGDIAGEHDLPEAAFDCIVLTQTLHLVYDMPKAVHTLWRALRPGGVLLVTVPWATPIDRHEWGSTWFWSLTPAALKRLLSDDFGESGVQVASHGNTLVAAAFLYGLAEHELSQAEFDANDPYCPVIVTGRAVK